MASDDNIWFRIGHALERARHNAPTARRALDGLAERSDDREGGSSGGAVSRPHIPSSDELVTAGVALVVDRALAGWGKKKEAGLGGLLRAGAAGAVAAILVDLVKPLLRREGGLPAIDHETAGRILSGVGQGLLYGGVVEPRVPGPALVKGALYGTLEYAVDPFGGLSGLLGSHTPQRKIPFMGDVFDGLDAHDRLYLEHLVFGIALALIYESRSSSNGMRPDEE